MPSKTSGSDAACRPVIVWFRNDLRIADNQALNAACKVAAGGGGTVIPLYILDDAAAGEWKPGGAARWWLHNSLQALGSALGQFGSHLTLRRGPAVEALQSLADETGAATIFCARRYEPWAIRQERDCKVALERSGLELKRFGGTLLIEPERLETKSGGPYRVYTPFWRGLCQAIAGERPIPPPAEIPVPRRWPRSEKLASWGLLPSKPDWASGFSDHWEPGEKGAHVRLDRFLESAAANYTQDRNRPDLTATSRLSPHLAHGEISPRLIWWRVANARDRDPANADGLQTFLKELVWREFSQHLLFHFPHIPEKPFRPQFENFAWRHDPAALTSWQRGMTGYPIVDAGMRELWQTGWMHNRVRMIVASFLVKHLLIPWQAGERWFWDALVDADLGNNAASWQWVAGSGADAAPYFRIFNPVTQAEKFDPEGNYIRRWIPELANAPLSAVHRPMAIGRAASCGTDSLLVSDSYPLPIVDHAAARARALAAFAELKE
ncbi:MAG: deoxyribodipyrimidine photo-lyase [Hyphomicrobiaceae bacterium]|nr:deoxyribodipyrimidine photo-lyase [Hyphomicrobiaceae bacterium]